MATTSRKRRTVVVGRVGFMTVRPMPGQNGASKNERATDRNCRALQCSWTANCSLCRRADAAGFYRGQRIDPSETSAFCGRANRSPSTCAILVRRSVFNRRKLWAAARLPFERRQTFDHCYMPTALAVATRLTGAATSLSGRSFALVREIACRGNSEGRMPALL